MASTLPMFGFRTTRENLDKLAYIANYNGRSANKELEQQLLKLIREFEKEKGTIQISES